VQILRVLLPHETIQIQEIIIEQVHPQVEILLQERQEVTPQETLILHVPLIILQEAQQEVPILLDRPIAQREVQPEAQLVQAIVNQEVALLQEVAEVHILAQEVVVVHLVVQEVIREAVVEVQALALEQEVREDKKQTLYSKKTKQCETYL